MAFGTINRLADSGRHGRSISPTTFLNNERRKKMSSDISKMSDEFHDWLEKCPVQWSKKHGEAIYTFWEERSEEEGE